MRRRTFLAIPPAVIAAAQLSRNAGPEEVRRVPTICEMCFWRCGVEAAARNGRVVSLRGLPGHPLNDGRLCPRGSGGLGAIYDPDRLKTPLLRTGARGSESFRRASWSDALDHASAELDKVRKRYGPESVAGLIHGFSDTHVEHFLKALGTPNIATPAYAECRGARDTGWTLTYGHETFSPETSDMANSRFIALLGYHLGENMHNTQVQDFAQALRRGAKLLVADPRFSTAAAKADWYLPVRPGTDLALLLAWIHVTIREKLYDGEYVAAHTTGFEQLQQAVASNTPQWAAAITEIPSGVIEETARAMAAAKPAVCIHPGRHAAWYGDDVQRSRAVAILNALLGSYGRPGGFFMPSAAKVPKFDHPPFPQPAKPSADGAGATYPFSTKKLAWGLVRATAEQKPYPIKAWVVSGANLFQSIPDTRITRKAIQQLDFLMVVDILPTEIAGWADVVLPECTYLERYDDLQAPNFRQPYVALRQPVVEPLGESRPNYDIFRELGERMGLAAWYPWRTWEEYLDQRLRGAGTSLAEMKRAGFKLAGEPAAPIGNGHKFATPSGKIELASAQLAARGFDPVPRYTDHGRPPEGLFRLLHGRSPLHTFGRTVNHPSLGSIYRENEVWVNAAKAAEMRLENGVRVRLVNEDGVKSLPVKVKVTQRIRPDCVYVVHGFGHVARGMRRARDKGAGTADLLTRVAVDPVMGAVAQNRTFVRLEVA